MPEIIILDGYYSAYKPLGLLHKSPTEICITSLPYLHQKSANWALNIVLLIIWCYCCPPNSSQISPLEEAVPS